MSSIAHELFFLPEQASTIAGKADAVLIGWILLSAVVTLAIVGAMMYLGIRYRRGSQVDRTPVDEATATRIEITWIIPTAVVFVLFFLWGGYVYYDAYTPPTGSDSLAINVVGKQWMWKVQHPDGVLEINEIHVPVGRKVVVTMTSEDVVHSLSLPAFRVKRDVIPGTYTQLWFEATRPGTYHLFCTQYCGLNHSRMRGHVVAMRPTEYAAWLARQHPERSLVEQGAALYKAYGCAACHAPGANARAPVLAGLYGTRVGLEGGAEVRADRDYLRRAIVEPNQDVVAGFQPIMPSYKGQMDESQVLALIAYLETLKPNRRASSP
ncbi:MAG: cytochrome c oxidase subunit II [Chromatiaceae bacterium]